MKWIQVVFSSVIQQLTVEDEEIKTSFILMYDQVVLSDRELGTQTGNWEHKPVGTRRQQACWMKTCSESKWMQMVQVTLIQTVLVTTFRTYWSGWEVWN